MSVIIKNPDKVIKKGNFTRNEDVPDTVLPNLKCPFCNRVLDYGTEEKLNGKTVIEVFYLSCKKCCFSFSGNKSRSEFKNFQVFYDFVKERLDEKKKKKK